ncbi:MAG: BrnT family toxin [Verrucomicrobiia bacterium]
MEFDWSAYQTMDVPQEEVAEAFEDAFSLRFLPSSGSAAAQSRFFCLGKTLGGRGLFFGYSSNGKSVKVLWARGMSEEEDFFYQRKLREFL